MKIPRAQKQENSRAFIAAFVAEVRGKGYAHVTLRDVARRAALGEGAIYKYFPSKEKILLAYYAEKMADLRVHGATLLKKPGYALTERIQDLLEFQIGRYEGEKDFLEKTFHSTFIAASLMWSEVADMRKAYLETVGAFVKAAEESGELPAVSWPGVVDELLWCHYVAVMMYWLKDGSRHHEDTTQFIDRTVNVFAALVAGPLLKQAEELVGFLVNRHLMPLLSPLLSHFGGLGRSKAGYGSAGMRQGMWGAAAGGFGGFSAGAGADAEGAEEDEAEAAAPKRKRPAAAKRNGSNGSTRSAGRKGNGKRA